MGYIPFFATNHQEVHVDTHGARGGGGGGGSKVVSFLSTSTR